MKIKELIEELKLCDPEMVIGEMYEFEIDGEWMMRCKEYKYLEWMIESNGRRFIKLSVY